MSVVALVIAPSIAITNFDTVQEKAAIETIVSVEADDDYEVSSKSYVMDTVVNKIDTIVDDEGNIQIQKTIKVTTSEVEEGISGTSTEKKE